MLLPSQQPFGFGASPAGHCPLALLASFVRVERWLMSGFELCTEATRIKRLNSVYTQQCA